MQAVTAIDVTVEAENLREAQIMASQAWTNWSIEMMADGHLEICKYKEPPTDGFKLYIPDAHKFNAVIDPTDLTAGIAQNLQSR